MTLQQKSWDGLERYRELFDSCPIGYIVTSMDGTIIEANRTIAQIFNREKEFFFDRSLSEFVTNDDLDTYNNLLREIKRTQIELCLNLPHTGSTSFQATVDSLFDENGEAVRIQWLLQSPNEFKSEADQIRRDEENYRNIVELSPQPIWVQCNGSITYCNDAAAKLLGASNKTDLLDKSIKEIIHPADQEVAEQRIRRVLDKNDIALPQEERLVRLDGEIIDVEVISSRIFYRGQAAIRVFIQDISSRKQAELALRASEERFRIFMDNTPTPVFIKDENGRYVYLNKVIEKLVDTPTEDLVGKTVYSRLPGEIANRLMANDALVLSSQQPQQFQETVVAADGSLHTQLVIKFPLNDTNDKRLVAGIAIDITERVKAELALKESERWLQTIIFNLPVLLLAVDRNGIITIEEGKSLRFLPHYSGNCTGKTIWECYSDVPEIIEASRRGLKGETFHTEVPLDDQILDVFIAPLQNENNINDGFIAVAMDITERRNIERERDELLVQAQADRTAAESSREHFVNILDSITDGFIALDRDWNFIYINSRFEQICSRKREDMLGRSIWKQFPELQRTQFSDEYRRAMKERTTVEFEAYYPPFNAWYAARVYPAQEGIAVYILDTTARKQAEMTRHDLLMRLTTAQEEERWRIARDLHDQLGQDLAVLMLGLKALPKYGPLLPPALSCVEELQSTVIHLMRQVRHVALNLRSEALGAYGLPMALQRYTEEWSHHHGIPVTMHSWGFQGRRVAPYIEATIYRIIQEAFTNVLRHANAKHVSVVLEHREDTILAIVEDDGQGFDVDAVTNSSVGERGLGLQGMKERVALVNGTLQIESRDGDGTTIYIRLPAEPTTKSLESQSEQRLL